MFLHFSINLIISKFKKHNFPQQSYDDLFNSIENDLRELGMGDVSVNKKMKDLNKSYTPLKLRAVDDKDLSIFSDCIYQSILLSSKLRYDRVSKIFLLGLERFTWEIAEGKDHRLKQVISMIQ